MTVLHCNIYLALRCPENFFSLWTASYWGKRKHYLRQFLQLAVTSTQQVFGVWIALYLPQNNKVYEVNAFYAEMFRSFFIYSDY